MSVSYWQDKREKIIAKSCDVCIVGAGITGLSVAYWLKKEDPNLKIIIVDKGALASGATGRNAGFVTCGSVEHFNRMVSKHGESLAVEIWQFCEENRRSLQKEIISDKAGHLDFAQKGSFSLASSQAELLELQNVAALMSKHNVRVELLNQVQTQKRLGVHNFVGGIKYCDDAEVHPVKLLSHMFQLVNCELLEHSAVYRVETTATGAREILTPDYKIKSNIVVYCANGYSETLDSYFSDKIYPTRGQILMMEPVAPFMEGPCYAHSYLDYFRQLPDGRLLIGGFRQLEADTEKGFSDHTTEKIQNALHEFVKNHLPQFTKAQVTHRWSGVMGFSKDGEPMVGSLPSDDQIFFCGGYTGHGLGMSFQTSRVLVDLIFGRKIPDWLSAKRF